MTFSTTHPRRRRIMFAVLAVSLASIASPTEAGSEAATAALKLKDGKDIGTATFTDAAAGVLIRLNLTGVSPGAHAVHVHEKGTCDSDFSTAGAIYNPLGAKHGFLNDDGPMAGDLPNVYAAADGTLNAEILSPLLSLSKESEDGLFDADGASLVLFATADDHLSEPEGNAGDRMACGKITAK